MHRRGAVGSCAHNEGRFVGYGQLERCQAAVCGEPQLGTELGLSWAASIRRSRA